MTDTTVPRSRWWARGVAGAGRTIVLVGAITACSATAGTPTTTPASAQRWCAQLDLLATTTSQLDSMDADDPGRDAALVEVTDVMSGFADIAAPTPIGNDWQLVATPPTSDATGRIGIDDDTEAAGRRVASWALANCQLSAGARQALNG